MDDPIIEDNLNIDNISIQSEVLDMEKLLKIQFIEIKI